MLTPIKKPIHRDLLDWEKKFNTQINKVRYVIEQTIANFKTWRILHTDYRRPFETFAETISAVIAALVSFPWVGSRALRSLRGRPSWRPARPARAPLLLDATIKVCHRGGANSLRPWL